MTANSTQDKSTARQLVVNQRGETIASMLVALVLGAMLLSATMAGYFDASRRSYDHMIMERTNEQAKAILDMMSFDLRMIGSGMPLGQVGFPVGDAVLGSATLPVLTTATATSISIRVNEQGASTVLTADFDPSVTSTFSVYSASDVEMGDTIYISNMTTGGTAGLKGVVTGVAGNAITINSVVRTAATTFKAGSIVERVTLVSYNSPADLSGITRNPETGAVLIAPGSSFSLTYYDGTGTALALPLTEAVINTSLTALQLTVNVTSPTLRKDGTSYSAQATQRIALRNLNVSR